MKHELGVIVCICMYVCDVFKKLNSQNARVLITRTCSLDSPKEKKAHVFGALYCMCVVVPRTALWVYVIVRPQCNALRQYLKKPNFRSAALLALGSLVTAAIIIIRKCCLIYNCS